MNYEGFTLDKEAGVAILTLNRPDQLNAITLPMAESFGRALDEVDKDDSLKVLIITGTGRGFCSGLDVSTFAQVEERAQTEATYAWRAISIPQYNLSKVYNLAKPTIAAINGIAAGAGLSLALLCDMRIASEKARFSAAFINMGLIPDCGATYAMPRIVGMAKAMEHMITGDAFDAAEAQRMGMVNRVVPEEEVMKVARELADRIARGPSLAVRLTKQAFRRGLHGTLEQQIEWETYTQYLCINMEDHKEAFRAFLEKRPPEFKGR